MGTVNARKLYEQYKASPHNCVRELGTAIEKRQIKLENFSIRELAEAFLGSEVVHGMDYRKSGGFTLREAASAVDTSAFSNIMGQIVFSEVKAQFELATMISSQLCTTRSSPYPFGEKVPGITGIGDEAEVVDEGQPYPTVGVGEEYVELPRPVKRGFIVPVTREAIVFDRTGVLQDAVSKGTMYLGVNKEKRVLDVVFGITNNYKRNGTSTNTYLTSGAYINSHSNTLVDWTDIENAELLFDAMTDPGTGEPIGAGILNMPKTLIVPTALYRTALRIVQATDIRFGDGASSTTATYGKNPLDGNAINVVTSPYVKSRTGSASTWFFGVPNKAFVYNEVWGIESDTAPAGNSESFTRDIQLQYKVSEMGAAGVMEPRYQTKNT